MVQAIMNHNPFEPPKTQAIAIEQNDSDDRRTARWCVRAVYPILAIPALYNFVCFASTTVTTQGFPEFTVRVRFNWPLIAVVVGIGWLFWHVRAMVILEAITKLIHYMLSRKARVSEWLHQLHLVSKQLVFLAIPGAALWAFWVHAYYQLKFEFFAISIPVGILAHLLGAAFYLQLFYRWFKVERSANHEQSTS